MEFDKVEFSDIVEEFSNVKDGVNNFIFYKQEENKKIELRIKAWKTEIEALTKQRALNRKDIKRAYTAGRILNKITGGE